MQAIVLVIHIILALALVGLVLLQRSEGGGLGVGGGGGSNNMGGLVSTRGSANFLTRSTAVVAGLFMLTSIGLTILVGGRDGGTSVLEENATLPGLEIPMEEGRKPAETGPEIPVTE